MIRLAGLTFFTQKVRHDYETGVHKFKL